MLSQKTYPRVDQYTDRLNKSVSRIQEMLKRGEERLGVHYAEARSHTRQTCHNIIEIRVLQEGDEALAFTAYTENISPSGLNFLSPGELNVKSLIVGIPIRERETTWFNAIIVRSRKFPSEDFWEYGVKFDGRLL